MKFSGATPYNYSKVVDRSHPDKDLVHNGTRKERKTSPTHFKPTPADEAIRAIPAKTKSHNLDSKSAPAPVSYGNDQMIPQAKSGEKNLSPATDALPKKWHKQGYSMELPSSLSGTRLGAKWGQ